MSNSSQQSGQTASCNHEEKGKNRTIDSFKTVNSEGEKSSGNNVKANRDEKTPNQTMLRRDQLRGEGMFKIQRITVSTASSQDGVGLEYDYSRKRK